METGKTKMEESVNDKMIKIQGWDKAKLGMSVEKVKSIYKKEVRCLNEMGTMDCYWKEYEEDKRFYAPYTFIVYGLEILGEKNTFIDFNFVNYYLDYKLFKISLSVSKSENDNLSQWRRKIKSWRNRLVEKYGEPSEVKITEVDEIDEIERKIEQEMEEETGGKSRKVYRWVDENNNTLVLIDNLIEFRIIYTEGELTKIWKSQLKKGKNRKDRKKKKYRKNIESF